jgi:hypothetical protein
VTDTIAKIARLQRIAEYLAVDTDPDRALFGTQLAALLSLGLPFWRAFELQSDWFDETVRHQRDQALRDIARRDHPGLRGKPLARAIDLARLRYLPTFERDRRMRRRPDGARGRLYDILMTEKFPGYSQLLNIFRGFTG